MSKEGSVLMFEASQTLTNVGKMKNCGVELFELKNNQWSRLHEYKLPIERFIRLYNNGFNLIGIGKY